MNEIDLDGHQSTEAKALQCYLLLIGMAQRRVLPTYGDIGELVDMIPRKVGELLTCLAPWLARNKLPPLYCIVVTSKTGEPGEGCDVSASELPTLREQVYEFKWWKVRPPSLAELTRRDGPAAIVLQAKYGDRKSKAEQIRAMARDGMKRGDIARALDAIHGTAPGYHRYQHVRGVLVSSGM